MCVHVYVYMCIISTRMMRFYFYLFVRVCVVFRFPVHPLQVWHATMAARFIRADDAADEPAPQQFYNFDIIARFHLHFAFILFVV